MAKSIKLGSDTYLDASGITIDSSGTKLSDKRFSMSSILNQRPIPAGETSYSCNWSDYDMLYICPIYYGNTYAGILISKSEFSTSDSSSRSIVVDPATGAVYSVYKNTTNSLYIQTATESASARGIRVYGIKVGI